MTVNTNHVARTGPVVSRQMLWQRWVALWNGDLSAGADLVTSTFCLHLPATWPQGEVRGRADLIAWLTGFRGAYADPRVTVEVGPVICGDLMAARWVFTGSYLGGGTGSTAPVGAPVRCVATDIVRIESGRVAECWLNFDPFAMFAEAGAATS
jgi:hypothetical protein